MPDSIINKESLDAQENTISEIRSAVSKLCQEFPGEYWKILIDTRISFQFINALTNQDF